MKQHKTLFLHLGLALVLLVTISILRENQILAKPQASIDIIEPDGNLDFVAEGLDYATQVWSKPWTFNELPDLLHPSYHLSVTPESGMLKGQILGNDPYFFLLFPGLPGAVNLGTGQIHAIDSDKYEELSFRFCTLATNPPQGVRFYWYSGFTNGPTYFSDKVQIQPGCHVYSYDLAPHSDWQGEITGLRLDPDEFQVGDFFFLDWLRLTEKGNTPSFEIQWADLNPTGGTLTLYLDTDTTGHDGFEIGQIPNASGQGSFHWGTEDNGYPLPKDVAPGSYFIYAQVDSELIDYNTEPITVSQVPLLDIIDPSFTSGPDYATVNGNPWDMDSSGIDGQVQGSDSYHYSGGELEAWNTGNDPGLRLNVPTSIDTSFYRYFSIELYSNHSFYTSRGGMMRLYWLNSWDAYTVMQDIIINTPATWRTYSMDLTQVPLESGGAQLPWSSDTWQILRFDPNENVNGVNWQWRIRDAKLTGPPIADSFFAISWEINNPEDEVVTTTWYYDTDNNSFDGTLIEPGRRGNSASELIASTSGRIQLADHYIYLPLIARNFCSGDCLTWDTFTVPPGEYFIYGCVNDGFNQVCRYSDVPVLVR